MAHFAKLDGNNKVIQVIVVNNNAIDSNNEEESGIAFCESLFGGTWIQTSYNERIRKNFAGVGFTYDVIRDAFIPLQPYLSWLLNEDTCKWEAPIDYPNDGNRYLWNEEIGNWVEALAL